MIHNPSSIDIKTIEISLPLALQDYNLSAYKVKNENDFELL